jgi:thiol-disulfide isomerase/thioredoxin
MPFNFKHPAVPYLLVLTGVFLIFIWARSAKGLTFEGFQAAAAASGSATPDYYFRMYYADWCPHCVSAKPEFAKLGESATVNGKRVKFEMINPETEPNRVVEKVNGYPTIRLYDAKNTLMDEYGGVRAHDDFMGFLEKKLK